MDGKEGTAVTAGVTGAGGKDKPERRSAGGGGGGGGMDLSEENVDAFYKKMLVRAPNKRQVSCMQDV